MPSHWVSRAGVSVAALGVLLALLAGSTGARPIEEREGPSHKTPPHHATRRHHPMRRHHRRRRAPASGIHKIKHVVIIMQENRSFDEYFGTYPGADGIPGLAGNPGNVPCIPDPNAGHCQRPYHNPNLTNAGGPHLNEDAVADVNHGQMDGFIKTVEKSTSFDTDKPSCVANLQPPMCVDVMGYHDQREIPHYWTYAKNFVLQDHMFEPVISWSLPSHIYMLSAWMANCTHPLQPMTCHQTSLNFPDSDGTLGQINGELGAGPSILVPHDTDDLQNTTQTPDYGWTDITYLLHKHHVSWHYYVDQGTEPDCANGQVNCVAQPQVVSTPEIWNPLPDFVTVHQDHQVANVVDGNQLFSDIHAGHLPAVSWVIPSGDDSEHAPGTITAGQDHVTRVVDAIMRSPDWNSTAIFVSWDDWGGYYDHVKPPTVDGAGYGLRVPGLVISPYARRGYIDHQTLSFDAYLKFIEDDFLGGQRLNPRTDGRPDPRTSIRESKKVLGSLVNDFNFNQRPRRPLLLPTLPPSAFSPGNVPGVPGALLNGLVKYGP